MGGNFPSLNLSLCALSSFSYQLTLNEDRGPCQTVMKGRSTTPMGVGGVEGREHLWLLDLFLVFNIGCLFDTTTLKLIAKFQNLHIL